MQGVKPNIEKIAAHSRLGASEHQHVSHAWHPVDGLLFGGWK